MVESEFITAELQQLRTKVDSLPFSNYCTSPQPGERRCTVEYEKFEHNVRQDCEKSGGQYIESFYKVDCQGESSRLVFAATDEPYCVGPSCGANEATNLAESRIETKVKEKLESSGYYSCNITYCRVLKLESRYRFRADSPTDPPKPKEVFDQSMAPSGSLNDNIFQRPTDTPTDSRKDNIFRLPATDFPTAMPSVRSSASIFTGHQHLVSIACFMLLWK